MRVKPGARIAPAWAAGLVFTVVERVFTELGHEPVLTSGRDGKHSWGSKHYADCAWDFRTNFFPNVVTKQKAAEGIRDRLGSDFDVVLETTHLHVEYDPKDRLG